MRYGSDKEVQAVCMLQKEQRLLEKRDSALELEKEYSLKLLELGSREVKLSQRRLKTNVAKIKSYLTAEEIKDFRRLEMLGKFKPEINTVSVSGAFTIAAAAKRLRLQAEQRMAANGLDTDGKPMEGQGKKRQQREVIERLTKSAPPRRSPVSNIRAASAVGLNRLRNDSQDVQKTLKRAKTCSTFQDFDSVFEDVVTLPDSPKTPRANSVSIASAVREPPRSGATSSKRQRPATSNTEERGIHPSRSIGTSLGYSSHDATERESREKDRSEVNPSTNRHLARRPSISGSSIDGDLVKGRAEERRQVLLDVEEIQCQKLMGKKIDFLERLRKWVQMNPGFSKGMNKMDKLLEVLQKEQKISPSTPTFSKENKVHEKRKLRKNDSFSGKVVFKKRQEPLEVEWTNLNKCRYLRIAEEDVDLSGVVTLAKEQMKALQSLRVTDIDDEDY